jgi:hypothetical protein
MMKSISSILIVVFISLVLLSSCEEYYSPKIDPVPSILVVEPHLTNDSRLNFVRITSTSGFYEAGPAKPVAGVRVRLQETGGKTITATDQGKGIYAFNELPKPGIKYVLRLTYLNDNYESDPVSMPEIPSVDNFYSKYKISKTYRTDEFGPPVVIQTPGRELCVDVPIGKNIQYYRFKWRAILQWAITPPPTPLGYPASTFGWNSISDQDLINLAGPNRFTFTTQLKNHPILSIPYDQRIYLDAEEKNENGWIIILEQFGIEKNVYEFYQELNKQFTAEGNLFDPVFAQVYGNLHCTTDPSKKILGYFAVNSYRQYRFYFNLWGIDQGKVLLREISRYPDIPNSGQTLRTPPDFWEYTY